jgi:hypothetical protein
VQRRVEFNMLDAKPSGERTREHCLAATWRADHDHLHAPLSVALRLTFILSEMVSCVRVPAELQPVMHLSAVVRSDLSRSALLSLSGGKATGIVLGEAAGGADQFTYA